MAEEPGKEWVETPLDTDEVDPRGIVEIVVEFDEGKRPSRPRPTNASTHTTSTRPLATSSSSPTTSSREAIRWVGGEPAGRTA